MYNTSNHFDHQAQNWDLDPAKVERAEIFAREINDFIKPAQKLHALEFGCGTGLLSYFLKDHFKTITLVDESKGMIEVLKEKIATENLSHFKPLQLDLFSEPLHQEFDVVYTLMTLHHIHDTGKIIEIFHKLLRPGGHLCIADLVAEDGSFHSNHPGFDGHFGFDKQALELLLLQHGFITEYYHISFVIEKDFNGSQRKYPLFLLIAKRN
jgi:2-polyprenyl-3-methyl-5-hydroxy-6-metoxy-1,4-benzoquinol methylase